MSSSASIASSGYERKSEDSGPVIVFFPREAACFTNSEETPSFSGSGDNFFVLRTFANCFSNSVTAIFPALLRCCSSLLASTFLEETTLSCCVFTFILEEISDNAIWRFILISGLIKSNLCLLAFHMTPVSFFSKNFMPENIIDLIRRTHSSFGESILVNVGHPIILLIMSGESYT
ncbi:hypothetical protein AWRI1631_122760 [Saccharomyces cerevisiae AWRI1631]|uniref:Uncharacterized protein n=1 Tax=Saccharomyces cerevisiae (strain AWRI1631) TaxID=545124 RepID=B5VNE9_YEAS6|nr:hypothetical protein AWRI1631_122760 [Saccharomyces cerevisiae AWRI1631]